MWEVYTPAAGTGMMAAILSKKYINRFSLKKIHSNYFAKVTFKVFIKIIPRTQVLTSFYRLSHCIPQDTQNMGIDTRCEIPSEQNFYHEEFFFKSFGLLPPKTKNPSVHPLIDRK